jgi:hypothetical protein
MTYANVMATVAVFLAVGGGAYAASLIGTDDLAPDAKARAINLDQAAVVVPPGQEIPSKKALKLNELTLRGACYEDDEDVRNIGLFVSTRSAADVNWTYTQRNGNDGESSVTTYASGFPDMPAGAGGLLAFGGSGEGEGTLRFEGQLVYSNSKRVITVTFHALENPETARCELIGTAVNGT